MNMKLLQMFVLLAVAAGSGTAMSQFLNMNIDNVKRVSKSRGIHLGDS